MSWSYQRLQDAIYAAMCRRAAADACEDRDDDDEAPDTTEIDEAAE